MKTIESILHLFFPQVCAVCSDELLKQETGICLQCLFKLPRTKNFNKRDNSAETLMAGRLPFCQIATFCYYAKGGVLQPIIHELKYNNKKELGVFLGRLFGNELKDSEFIKPINLIIPVPLHPKKAKQRGYNQSEMIAKGFSEVTSIPMVTDCLIRKVHNPTQTKRTKTERWLNVNGIFELQNSQMLHGKHILLIDDVITTGSTIEACGVAINQCKGIKTSIAIIGEVY